MRRWVVWVVIAAALLAFASTAGGAIAPWDPQQTNVPYLGWRGEELRLVKCAPEIVQHAGQATDWIVEDWSGLPVQPADGRGLDGRILHGHRRAQGRGVRQGRLRLAARRARADQARRVRSLRQSGAQAPVPRRLALARSAHDPRGRRGHGSERPARRRRRARRPDRRRPVPRGRPARPRPGAGLRHAAARQQLLGAGPPGLDPAPVRERRHHVLGRSRSSARDDHRARVRPDALADVGHPRRPRTHRRPRGRKHLRRSRGSDRRRRRLSRRRRVPR